MHESQVYFYLAINQRLKLTNMSTLKTISRKALKDIINQYMLSCIDSSDYGINTPTDKDKVNFVMDCFNKEVYSWKVKQNKNANPVNCFGSDWLPGLPSSFNVAFENYEILQIGLKWEILNEHSPEYKKDAFLNNWFNYIANKFFQLHKQLNATKK